MFGYRKTQKIEFSVKDSNNNCLAPYTIVSACYNVSSYIDDFIESIVNQTLDFLTNINLILVDDGSTDDTLEKISQWQSKYPKNIKVFFKENGGQSTARNFGLKYVNSEWVTFTDPDDFLDKDYFKTIDYFIKHKCTDELSLICTNIIFYKEFNKSFIDAHPLSQKFSVDEQILNVTSLCSKNIQLHASSALFKTSIIKDREVLFPNLKPNFEDAYFVCIYFTNIQNNKVALLKNAKYYYRKRAANNSSLDLSWNDPRKYSELFVNGYIPVLLMARKNRNIRELLESIVLYSLLWQIKYFLNNNHSLDVLNDEQKQTYLYYLDKCFTYIDESTIYDFTICKMNHYLRSGIINCFKKDCVNIQNLVSIEKYDLVKNEVLLKYCFAENTYDEFYVNNERVLPTSYKIVRNNFLNRIFILQKLVWLPVKSNDFSLHVVINNVRTRLSCLGFIKDSFCKKELIEYLSFSGMLLSDGSNEPWLFVDRIDCADDNAEHLYRYIKNLNLKNNIYFALSKKSKDWQRLTNDGFNLVDFGSVEHQQKFGECSKIISSQIDNFVFDFWNNNSWRNKQIIFLRHGVSKDDASIWLNSKKRIDLIVSTTSNEYHSIVDDYSKYQYTEKEVKLLGLCRYDNLQRISNESNQENGSKQILIFPTWRNYLFKNFTNFDNTAISDGEFQRITSEPYFKNWHEFLVSKELRKLCDEFGYQLVFCAHAKVLDFIEYFEIPEYVQILINENSSLQELFSNSSLLITDYSSVAFDISYLNKPILYFQFDRDVFWKMQSFRQGYFSYDNDGFGSVCVNSNDLIVSIKSILINNCNNPDIYKRRILDTFCFRDQNNCQRNYNEIVNIDVVPSDSKFTINSLSAKIMFLVDCCDWLGAINLIDSTEIISKEDIQQYTYLKNVLKARIELEKGNFTLAQQILGINAYVITKFDRFIQFTKLLLLSLQNKFHDASVLLSSSKFDFFNSVTAKVWFEIQFLNTSYSLNDDKCKQIVTEINESSMSIQEKGICIDYIQKRYFKICRKFMIIESDNPNFLLLSTLNVNRYYQLIFNNPFLSFFVLKAAIEEKNFFVQDQIIQILKKEYGLVVEQIMQMLRLI